MGKSQPGKPFYESFGFKLFVAIAIIIIFAVIFLIQIRQGEQDSAGASAKPSHSINPEPKMTTPESTKQLPQFPAESKPDKVEPIPAVPGQTTMHELPGNAAPAAKAQPLPASAPQTQVHSLSDAEAVMGPASPETGEVGVTRTYKLPGQEGQSKTNPLPADPQKH